MIRGLAPRVLLGPLVPLCLALAPARAAAGQAPVQIVAYKDPFAPSATGLRQIAEIMKRLGSSLGEIPPDVVRIAVSQIKTDAKHFDNGTTRYIQAQVEETFRKEGRRTVVTSPELRTFRVVSTDSSFKFTNTVLSIEELWNIGEKLRVDGFIEGSCSKSKDNDVILNLKLFRHRTGEIVWSGSFVAGPNEKKADLLTLDYSVSSSLRMLPVEKALVPGLVPDSLGAYPVETLAGFRMTQYAFDLTVSETVNPEKWLLFSVSAGYGYAASAGLPDSSDINLTLHSLKLGAEMLGIFFRKTNPDLGYWLGTYVGYQEYIPFLWRGHLSAVTLGYRSRVSRHFSLGGGALFMVFNRNMRSLYGDYQNAFLTYAPVAYEIAFLHYTF